MAICEYDYIFGVGPFSLSFNWQGILQWFDQSGLIPLCTHAWPTTCALDNIEWCQTFDVGSKLTPYTNKLTPVVVGSTHLYNLCLLFHHNHSKMIIAQDCPCCTLVDPTANSQFYHWLINPRAFFTMIGLKNSGHTYSNIGYNVNGFE